MPKIIIAVMDGALALIRDPKKRHRIYLSDVVKEIAYQTLEPDSYVFHAEKGGIWNAPNRRMKQFILDHCQSGNYLLAFGKSYGARDMVNIIHRLRFGIAFMEHVTLITVDPEWLGNFNRSLIVDYPITEAFNVYQPNGILHGNPVKAKYPCIHGLPPNTFNHKIEEPGINHFTITTHSMTKGLIQEQIEASRHAIF